MKFFSDPETAIEYYVSVATIMLKNGSSLENFDLRWLDNYLKELRSDAAKL